MEKPADEFEPLLDTQRSIAADLACRECGYNLRTASSAGRCPECGSPVVDSVRHYYTWYAPAARYRSLAAGARLLAFCLGATVIALFLNLTLVATSAHNDLTGFLIVAWVMVIPLLTLGGLITLTRGEHRKPGGEAEGFSARRLVRWLLALTPVLFAAFVAFAVNGSSSQWLAVGAAILFLASLVSIAVVLVRHIHNLVKSLESQPLDRLLRIALLTVVLTAVASAAAAVSDMLRGPSTFLVIALAVGASSAVCWICVLIGAARGFDRVVSSATETEAADLTRLPRETNDLTSVVAREREEL
jgi:hypothetical protein